MSYETLKSYPTPLDLFLSHDKYFCNQPALLNCLGCHFTLLLMAQNAQSTPSLRYKDFDCTRPVLSRTPGRHFTLVISLCFLRPWRKLCSLFLWSNSRTLSTLELTEPKESDMEWYCFWVKVGILGVELLRLLFFVTEEIPVRASRSSLLFLMPRPALSSHQLWTLVYLFWSGILQMQACLKVWKSGGACSTGWG